MRVQLTATATGIWVYISPGVLGFGGAAAVVDRVAGALIVAFSFVAVWEFLRGVRLANRPPAVVLLVAPWLLDQPTTGVISSVAAGAAVFALSFFAGEVERSYGGGWAVLLGGDR